MKKYNLIIGNYISTKNNFSELEWLQEIINNKSNAIMICYQWLHQLIINNNYILINQFIDHLKTINISIKNIILHSSYVMNLANIFKKNIFCYSIKILKKEIYIADKLGIPIIIIHPGNTVGATNKQGLDNIIKGLNFILTDHQNVKIALETMSGKGTELGTNFQQLKYIIDNIKFKNKIGICWDICHLHDSGYNFNNNLENIINEFDVLIGLKKLLCIHINDSKNIINSHKDRHTNIGYGYIGFKNLLKIIYHKKLNNKIKILETPFFKIVKKNKKYISSHNIEIQMIKKKRFINWLNKK